MTPEEWSALTAKLDEMATNNDDAVALLEGLAAAFFPHESRGLEHLTWAEQQAHAAEKKLDGPAAIEEKLRAAELRFRTLVEQIPAVTFMAVLGEGKNEVYVSPHIEQMLGFTQAEWLADPFSWFWQLHEDDRDLWNAEFARGCRNGGPFRAECRFYANDGHIVWVHGEARLVKDEIGRPLFLQGVAFDITESKRAQDLLLKEAVRGAKHDEELAIARRVQTSILPRDLSVDGLEVSATMIPADDVGGDYYDILKAPDGAWLAIGDVSGHGLNAGLVMLMVQSATMAITKSIPNASPRDALCRLNEVLYDNIRTRLEHDDHVTFSLMRYTRDGNVVFAGAHEDILVCRKSTRKVDIISTPGTWLGARRDIQRATTDALLHLDDGDIMVLYTDGITEAMNQAGQQFDLDRLASTIEDLQDRSSEEIRDGIVTKVKAWMHVQTDDITLVVIRYRSP
jgi:PAS domain S-box-containing protein